MHENDYSHSDHQMGRIEQTTAEAEADLLQPQAGQHPRWAVSARTGEWYIYNGVAWQPADAQNSDQLSININRSDARSSKPVVPSRTLLKSILGVAIIGFIALIFLSWTPMIIPSEASPPLNPSPRPPVHSKESDGHDSSQTSSIFGTVTDLSTGQPGAGLEVSINGQIVRTDTDGSYSITGLSAGMYTAALELHGQGTPAQDPMVIYVDGRDPATADLGFYSQTPPTSTPSPTATATPTATPTTVIEPVNPAAQPVKLPPSGGDIRCRPWLISGLGLLLVVGGSILPRLKALKPKIQ